MVTAYSPILKLALPVQGELSGTWGDVVNDNITSMVEQAIAGRAVIDTWTTDSHTLTTANGTTSESRCAMLELTDTGTALTGAGTVICPTASKIYIVKNDAGQNITVKTVSGTGILVPDGRTTFLFCDGTNVVEALTHTTSLQLGTSTVVTAVLDEDNMASDSATSLATQQSIKAYVDAQVGANNELSEVLANGNTSGANDIIVDNGQKITVNTIDETTADSGVTIDSVLLKDDGVNATNLEVTNIKANDGTAAGSIADSTGVVTVASAVLTTADINGGTADDVVIGGTTPAAATVTTATANTSLNIAGTVTVTSILDEDNMASDDPAGLATQQSIKAYVDAQVGANNELSEVLANGNTTGGTDIAVSTGDDITFADNSKAIFGGVTSELQIYSDGSNSYITDTGTGNFFIRGADYLVLEDSGGNNYFEGVSGGTAKVFYAGSTKLQTTNTGVDITGTLTSDGLTVDGAATINTSSTALLNLNYSGATKGSITTDGINLKHNATANMYFNVNSANRMLIEGNGDITFYDTSGNASFVYDESAGSTFNEQGDNKDFRVESDSVANMFFVDASTNRIGINTNAPTTDVDIVGQGANFADIKLRDVAGRVLEIKSPSDSSEATIATTTNHNLEIHAGAGGATNYITFKTDTVERLEISSNSVIFNDTGADTDFRVESDSNANMLFVDAGGDYVSVGTAGNLNGKLNVAGSIVATNVQSIDPDALGAGNVALGQIADGSGWGAVGVGWKGTGAGDTAAIGYAGETLYFAMGDGTNTNSFATVFKLGRNEIVVNEDSNNIDFRVESDTNTHALFVDAANDRVGIKTSDPTGAYALQLGSQSGTSGEKKTLFLSMGGLYSTDSVATNQYQFAGFIGTTFSGTDVYTHTSSELNKNFYMGLATDNAYFNNDRFVIVQGGQERFKIGGYADTAVIFNEGGVDYDFRVESDGQTHMLFVDASTNRVGINNNAPQAFLHVTSADGSGAFRVEQTNTSAGGNAWQALFEDDSNVDQGSANSLIYINSNRLNTSTGKVLKVVGNGKSSEYFSIYDTGVVTVNESSLSTADFRVESDTITHALFVDAGNSRVGMNESDPDNTLHVKEGDNNDSANNIYADAFSSGAMLKLENAWTGVVPAAQQTKIAGTRMTTVSNAGYTASGQIHVESKDFNNYDAGDLVFATGFNTSALMTERLRMNQGEAVFNDTGVNTDFRVESDSNFACFFVDAGNGRIGINQDVPGYTVDVVGGNNSNTDGIAVRPLNESQTMIYSFLGMRNTYYTQFTVDSGNTGGSDYFQFFAGTEDVDGELLNLADGGTIFNNGAHDRDFRVESDSNANMLLVDAGLNTVQVGTTLTFGGSLNVSSGGIGVGESGSAGFYRRMYWNEANNDLRFWNGINEGIINSSGAFVDASDVRLKKDIADIEYGIDTVKSLKPRKYKLKSSDVEQVGFVAQEMELHVPEIVTTGINPDNVEQKGIAYGQLTAVLTKAMQEQQTIIETLEARITALENA